MKSMLYKGYVGTIEYSEEDGCFFGKVLENGNNLVAYEGQTEDELRKDFEEAVDRIIVERKTEELFTAPPFAEKE